MLTAILVVFIGCGCLAIGYFTRELKEILKRIELAAKILIQRKDKEEQKPKGMGFGDPMSMTEFQQLEEQERIDALNP